MGPLALFPKLATRLCNLYCHIDVDCHIGIISELVSSTARVISVKCCSDGRTSGPKDRTPRTPGSDKNDTLFSVVSVDTDYESYSDGSLRL